MLIGDIDYPLSEAILTFVLIASLAFTTLLFRKGQGNYSIKYQLMHQRKFFRQNQCALYIVEYLYKLFFILPFLLLIAIAVIQGISNPLNLAPILINGLIIIIILYPTKTDFFYVRLAAIWVLTFGSQLSTLFIYLTESTEIYYILSVIFYTANILYFFLSMLAIEGVYWQISEAIIKFKDEVEEVNEQWIKGRDHIPFMFHGGIYGLFCNAGQDKSEGHKSYKIYIILYFISLLFMGVYAFLVYNYTGSYLGIVGLVANIIYDIFVTIFAALDIEGRSLITIFLVMTAGRLLSFCFGSTLWLLGYCVLYFGVGTFIGWIIINKHLPLKHPSKVQTYQNALKTPEFVLLVLTIEIVVMIISEVYGVKSSDTVEYNGVTIPIWQWGIIAIIAAWVVILYMVSVRILIRHRNRIFALNQYYFGFQHITQYYLYKLLSYLLLIGLGLYAYLYLNDLVILVCCIFLPLLYLCLLALGISWETNDYQILADIDDYNKRALKEYNVKKKRQEIIEKNTKLKQLKRGMRKSNLQGKQGHFLSSIRSFKDINLKNTQSNIKLQQKSQQKQQKTLNNLLGEEQQKNQNNAVTAQFKPNRDWRTEQMPFWEMIENFTPSDHSIIRSTIVFIILTVGYCCCCYFWAQSKFGISFTVCLLSYLTLLSYYKCYKRGSLIEKGYLVLTILGFALGITYWSIFNDEIIGPLAYSFCYIIIGLYFLFYVLQYSPSLLNYLSLGILIFLQIIFILITFGLQTDTILVSVFSLIFFILATASVPLYFKLKQDYIPKPVTIVSSLLIASACIGVAVAGYVLNVLSSFAIFTICMAFVYLSLLLSAIGVALTRYSNVDQNPIIYSSYGSPHYRFDSSKQVLKPNEAYTKLFSFSSITLVIYAGIISVFFQQKFFAICALALLQLTNTFVEIMTSISLYYSIGRMKKDLTDQIILKALKKLKGEYMIDETEGEDSPYYKIQLDKRKQEALDTGGDQNWNEVVKYHYLYIQNVKEEEKFLFFWIALIKFYLVASRKQKIIQALIELKQIQEELNQVGIFLESLNYNLNYREKYKKVMQQLDGLEPFSYVIYEQILEQHRHQQSQKKSKYKQIDQANQQKQAQRDEDLFKNIKQVGDPQEQVGKFKQLIKDLGRKNLYTDNEFPADQNSLDFLTSQVEKWRRPNVGQILAKDGMSADDVKQGNIGDCYLISSFGVLGDRRIKQALGMIGDNSDEERWTNAKGAYMVRFFKFSKEIFVTIDDQMPVNSEDEWVFAKSQDPNQFWPGILEKAYAKLYSGYFNIVEGKCHRVLSEFTGGFPFQLNLEESKSNTNGLWNQIMNSKKNGYLMGAGTPSNALGDKAYSKRGIVQGHAYSVIDARQVDDHRVIKLKNPHGSAGREWIGDFADNSDQMTKRMLQLLDHTISEDGFFWMTIEDFVRQFKSLYICAVFDDRWKKIGPINSQWTQQNSKGLPNLPGCQDNPHYGIRVTKKCSIFISLTQEAKSALKGENFIYMRVQRNDGKRMRQQDINSQNLVGKPQRPIDSVAISTEIQLQAPQYPYIFSLMVCSGKANSTGKYSLEFYSQDNNFEIIEDSKFDRH